METTTPAAQEVSATAARSPSGNVFHVGYPKTGSTWLQQHVFPRLDGIRYGSPDAGLRRLVSSLYAADDESFLPDAVRAALEQTAGPTLFSDESIVGPMFGDAGEGPRNAERLHRVAPDARVLLLVRRQQEMLGSLYAQYVNMGGTRSLEAFLGGVAEGSRFSLGHLEYDRLVSVYAELFGRKRVWVVPYEHLREGPAAFLESLSAFLDAAVPADVSHAWVNRSLSRPTQALLRSWNRGFRRSQFNPHPRVQAMPGGRAVRNLLQRRVDPVLRRLARDPAGERALLEQLARHFAQGNERLQGFCEYRLSEWDYPLP